jgi:predicted nucleic acid-binding protein
MKEAFAIVTEWPAQPAVEPLNPGPLHASILERLVIEGRVSSALVTAAVLAALAIEYGAVLPSADQDFGRFKELRRVNPLLNEIRAD